jgi:hypothetical protein
VPVENEAIEMNEVPPAGLDSGDALAALVVRFTEAERQLYPLALVDPDIYQRSVRLVGLLGDFLSERALNVNELASIRVPALARLHGVASSQGIVLTNLDDQLIVDAALAQHYRVLLAQGVDDEAEMITDRARAAGEKWAPIQTPDNGTLGFAMSHQWVDLHLSSGTRLVRSVDVDQATGSPIFRIEVYPGSQLEASLVLEMNNRQEWLDEAEAIRADMG